MIPIGLLHVQLVYICQLAFTAVNPRDAIGILLLHGRRATAGCAFTSQRQAGDWAASPMAMQQKWPGPPGEVLTRVSHKNLKVAQISRTGKQ